LEVLKMMEVSKVPKVLTGKVSVEVEEVHSSGEATGEGLHPLSRSALRGVLVQVEEEQT
jgi:hypothetical protein